MNPIAGFAGGARGAFFAVLFISLLTACQTMREPSVRGESRVFDAGPEVAFEAAGQALEERDFRIVENKPAERKMRAVSPIRSDAGLQTATQRELVLFFRETPEGKAEVDLSIWLVEENLFRFETPLATRVFLDRSPLYSLIFSDIQIEIDNLLASREDE
ncbi:MAG: hypothetical protein WD490_11170 [Opitutales bacterium]